MDAIDAILTRRSVRMFLDKPVEHEVVEQLLTAAMSAPSAVNQQPWHFVVVDQREFLDKIAEIHPYAKMCKQAPLAIIPCYDTTLEKSEGYGPIDTALATENLLLAVRALGLGAVYLGVYPREDRIEEMKQLFNLPETVTPLAIIPIGYTKMQQAAKPRFKAERVHHNNWEE